MADVTDATTGRRAPTPDDALRIADAEEKGVAEPMVAADGTPLKKSLARALRREKMRALLLIAPLLIFVLVAFIAPIVDMLFRSVENQIISENMPRTVVALGGYESGEPDEAVYEALAFDLTDAAERRNHTRVGSRLNYETTGISSLFRQTGRAVDDVGEVAMDEFVALDEAWEEPATWAAIMGSDDWLAEREEAIADGTDPEDFPRFELRDGIEEVLPKTASIYLDFARFTQGEDEDDPADEDVWTPAYQALYTDITQNEGALSLYEGPGAERLATAAEAAGRWDVPTYKAQFLEIDEDWGSTDVWGTFAAFSAPYTAGYFLNAVDLKLTPEGVEPQPEGERIYGLLFKRTFFMSGVITISCILLGYPVAWLLSNVPARRANLLMILVLLPFWTSLLVRTSAWKVMLQQQGVINDVLVWLGIVSDANRLVMINNQFGTIVAMTHILLPFMILPLYSVMSTIPPSYLRAAKSLGATNSTAFWRVYFPQSVPGIGAGSILVFILSIGYYITPEIVGGTSGTFISNRIAYHISSSLNWGLAAALGTILLAVVLVLYYLYDRIVGIDNVKLGG
ncbi:ABC transporter permease [Roseicyclus sp. F158]|uniref:ABC transporter permease n=1 Tax=Tropicimonas omnivorans TaxID=3075590 RepID=A0ABU3DF44_9RHOB|nr:ABC transporter permease [Roseicyclus sp. F158]MDT0682340.1 ABC transporter permease [Roseicyclus sp. F158]